ncbi:Uncharacterised protein [Shigella sonnei]|nr:Uncharacterised protein [Shigella sonnei]CTC58874.1 Uncharacterised protein [Shigella sonnei]CTC76402.1 Uncharacterised protein [Shigella sonnei]
MPGEAGSPAFLSGRHRRPVKAALPARQLRALGSKSEVRKSKRDCPIAQTVPSKRRFRCRTQHYQPEKRGVTPPLQVPTYQIRKPELQQPPCFHPLAGARTGGTGSGA